MIRNLLIATAMVAFSSVAATPVSAQFGEGNSPNPLFSQYATGGAGMTNAGLYPAPHYSPQLGAQSYYTYQPLMPHEMMYQHSRNYYNYYNTGGYMGGNNSLNKTSVRWQSGTNHMGPLPFSTGLGNLNYRMHAKIYCLDGNCDGGGRGRAVRGHRRGGLGCADGNCNTGTAYSSDVYDSGCASGGCSASLNDGSLQR